MDLEQKPISINITLGSLFKAVLVLILLYFFYLIRDILLLLFVSLILASALDPLVDRLQEKKVPRGISVMFIYLILLSLIAFILITIVPPITQEIGDLAKNFPDYLERVSSSFSSFNDYSAKYGIGQNIGTGLDFINSNLQSATGGVLSTVSGFFGGIVSFFLVMVLTFYMVVEENAIKKLVWSIAPVEHQPYIMQLINRMQKKIGLWLRGQLILSFFIFILSYVGLLILGVKYALVLALIAGLTEFVPYLGPMIGAIPAVFLALTQSPLLAMFVAILYYVIQLTENNILVPKVMQKTVGLNPIISITVLLVGFQIAGIAGAILSIPVATAASILLGDLFAHKQAGLEEYNDN
jgi:predicted PurR-regulated permease PerM